MISLADRSKRAQTLHREEARKKKSSRYRPRRKMVAYAFKESTTSSARKKEARKGSLYEKLRPRGRGAPAHAVFEKGEGETTEVGMRGPHTKKFKQHAIHGLRSNGEVGGSYTVGLRSSELNQSEITSLVGPKQRGRFKRRKIQGTQAFRSSDEEFPALEEFDGESQKNGRKGGDG